MFNTNAINIYTDGAMDYDSKQTGGTGFIIIFPEDMDIPDIEESFRRDHQGIHRLEMIAILEAIDSLGKWFKSNGTTQLQGKRVIIHTDRISLTDKDLLSPYKIAEWRKNKWKNHEGKPIKDDDLLDQIDKARKKLYRDAGLKAEIIYVRRKLNRKADKLSKIGKMGASKNRKNIRDKVTKVSRRKHDGDEIHYKLLSAGDEFNIQIYLKNIVQDEYEVKADIVDGRHKNKFIRIYITPEDEQELHRHHSYSVTLKFVYKNHVRIRSDFEEIDDK